MKKIIFSAGLFVLLFPFSYINVNAQTLINPKDTSELWYSWAEYNGKGTDIFCKRWNGIDWDKPFQLTNDNNNNFTPSISLDKNGNPWITWIESDGIGTSIFCEYWNGREWSRLTQVDNVDIYHSSMPAITFDGNNTPWIAWSGNDNGNDDIYVSYWDGSTWASPVQVNESNNTPDIMPAIASDADKNIIITWCGIDNGTYRLFFSKREKDKWSEPKIITKDSDGFSADLPNLLKTIDGGIEAFWFEKHICFKSLWNGRDWSEKEETEFLLPEDFFAISTFGPASVSWTKNNLSQSIRITPPKPQGLQFTYISHSKNITLSSLWDIFSSNAYAEEAAPATEPVLDINKYIAFGDSITEGVGASDRAVDSYPPKLQNLLCTYIRPSTVLNEGVGGERTIVGLERIPDVLSSHNAKYILIMEGTNDMTWGYSTDTIIYNLEAMADNAIRYGTTPIMAKLPPRLDFIDDFVKNDVNPAIAAMAQRKGLACADQYTKMAADKTKYLSDVKHPNDDGYTLMAHSWYDTLSPLVNPPKSSSSDDGGCGSVPPIYRGRNSGRFNNITPLLFILWVFVVLKRRFCH